ncbi:MAG: leucine-rich repeat domain-containing protein, partial [Clostridia bacterium]|nr:leucine-rich repeat domain-containing protein [Clostridia bacterium]
MKNGVLLIIKRALLAAAVVCVFAMLLSANAENYGGACGENVTWSLDTETGVLTISGTGSMSNTSYYTVPWYSYRDTIKKAVIEDGVQSVGNSAFSDCITLSSVDLGNGVGYIGQYVFSGCVSLTSVSFGNNLKSIGYCAFSACEQLKDVYYGGNFVEYGQIDGVYYIPNISVHFADPVGKGECGTEANFYGNTDTGKLTLSGAGAVTSRPWSIAAGAWKSVVIGEDITELPENA